MPDHSAPRTTDEIEFAKLMRDYYRRAGYAAAYELMDTMNDASDDGAYREELLRAARDAVAGLPVLH